MAAQPIAPSLNFVVFLVTWGFLCWVFDLGGDTATLLFFLLAGIWGMSLSNKELEQENQALKDELQSRDTETDQPKRFNMPL